MRATSWGFKSPLAHHLIVVNLLVTALYIDRNGTDLGWGPYQSSARRPQQLRTGDAEMAEVGHRGQHIERTTRNRYLSGHKLGREYASLDRLPEVAPHPPPGPDLGHGMDLGF